jgi:hypothetical protein
MKASPFERGAKAMGDDDDKVIRFPQFERIEVNDALSKVRGLPRLYILVNRTPMPVDDPMTWANEMAKRLQCAQSGIDPWRVDETVIGNARISTVFLGIDHSYLGGGPPILFETMVFGGRLDDFMNRCATWEEAETMHAEAVALARQGHLRVIK